MIDESITRQNSHDLPGEGKGVSLLGVPLSFGQSMAGVDLGPGAIRVAGLVQRIAKLGYEVEDLGDLPLERPRSLPAAGEKVKYLSEIHQACERLASE
ncbi:MAG: arginase, partial [Blastocatellia bacterium]|nr:arginase [Blastocatellia bacterium]